MERPRKLPLRLGWIRKAVDYDCLIPPYGSDCQDLTVAQARENFEWFIQHIPARMEYFRARCASDLRVSHHVLDYSADSLIPIWRWFLDVARMVATPKDELKRMKEGAKIFGDSYVNEKVFSTPTVFMMRDIGMYLGEVYVRNYSPLYWTYYTTPKHEVSVKKPVIAGFWAWVEGYRSAPACVDPIGMVEGAASEFYRNAQQESDLYDLFVQWIKYIPRCDKHSKHIPWSKRP